MYVKLYAKLLYCAYKHETMNAVTAVVLETRRECQGGVYPVKIRVTFQRKQRYYALGYSLTKADFQKVQGDKPRGEFKDLKVKFNAMEERAIKVIEKLPEFSFDAFKEGFLKKKSTSQDVFSYYERYIEDLKEEGRTGTASSYQCSFNSLKSFHPKKLSFEKVTPEFLRSYENWMMVEGNSGTTVGIYLRALRTLCNIAIEKGVLTQQAYPFGKRKYQIPASQNIKKALSLDDIQKVFDYEPQTQSEAKGRDLWLFSYLCNGINVKDIARLKYRNIENDRISFIRAKTERTSKKNLKPIVAILTPEAKEIIHRWGNEPLSPESYVFDILTEGVTPDRERALVQQATKNINKYIKKIAETTGIEKHVTTYTARHSFSTILKRSGAPIEFISESLGHHDLKTTESYLDSFEDDVKKQYASFLTSFKQSN